MIFSTQKRHFLKCACLLACHTNEVVVLYLARQLNRYTAGGQFHTAGQFCTEHRNRHVNINIDTCLPLNTWTAHFVCPFVAWEVRFDARSSRSWDVIGTKRSPAVLVFVTVSSAPAISKSLDSSVISGPESITFSWNLKARTISPVSKSCSWNVLNPCWFRISVTMHVWSLNFTKSCTDIGASCWDAMSAAREWHLVTSSGMTKCSKYVINCNSLWWKKNADNILCL